MLREYLTGLASRKLMAKLCAGKKFLSNFVGISKPPHDQNRMCERSSGRSFVPVVWRSDPFVPQQEYGNRVFIHTVKRVFRRCIVRGYNRREQTTSADRPALVDMGVDVVRYAGCLASLAIRGCWVFTPAVYTFAAGVYPGARGAKLFRTAATACPPASPAHGGTANDQGASFVGTEPGYFVPGGTWRNNLCSSVLARPGKINCH